MFTTPPRRTKDPICAAAELNDQLEGLQLEDLCISDDDARATQPQSLRVVTWNMWFDKRSMFWRCQALLLEVFQHHPHVICLQEVTEDTLDLIACCPWILKHYSLSTEKLTQSYDVLMLARHDLNPAWWSLKLPTAMGRRCLIMDCCILGISLRIATVHLESYFENADWRGRQLKVILANVCCPRPDIDAFNHALHLGVDSVPRSVIVCGDFNFCSSCPLENSILEGSGFVDVWPYTHCTNGKGSMDPGFTVDTSFNHMLWELKGRAMQVRFDRVLLGCPTMVPPCTAASCYMAFCNPVDIKLLGLQPFTEGLWASDHFGLCAEIGVAVKPF